MTPLDVRHVVGQDLLQQGWGRTLGGQVQKLADTDPMGTKEHPCWGELVPVLEELQGAQGVSETCGGQRDMARHRAANSHCVLLCPWGRWASRVVLVSG
jgi:hypothetical protein